MKKLSILLAALMGLFFTATAQLIDDGQFNLGVSTSLFSTALADVQTGRSNDGRTNEAFARLRLSVVYLKVAAGKGQYQQSKLERYYKNDFLTLYGEFGFQTSPDWINLPGGLGGWLQTGGVYGWLGNKVSNHLYSAEQVPVNTGYYWGYSFGAGIELDQGEITIGDWEISPAIIIEKVDLNYLDDYTWDSINGGIAKDKLRSWRISLMIRFGSLCGC